MPLFTPATSRWLRRLESPSEARGQRANLPALEPGADVGPFPVFNYKPRSGLTEHDRFRRIADHVFRLPDGIYDIFRIRPALRDRRASQIPDEVDRKHVSPQAHVLRIIASTRSSSESARRHFLTGTTGALVRMDSLDFCLPPSDCQRPAVRP
jgi:hypothetical protein